MAYIISLNRKEISDYYKRNIQAQFLSLRFEYWNLNDLIEKIDTHFPEYWGHTDTFIKPYEDLFISEVEEDNELKCLKLDKKYIDMLDIFIEPRISIIISDEKDSSIVFTRSFNREKIVASGNYILTGDAGTGKSTLQKKIGKEIVIRNAARDKKTLPILIRQLDIVANSDSIEKAIDSQLLKAFTDFDLKKVFRDYELLILIDSIDEFSKDKKAKILADIQRLSTDFDLRYVISTRDDHYLLDGLEVKKEFDRVRIENFNLNQAKEFLEHFFCFDFDKSGKLLESLRSNKILEKLAVTPLTLSLISILFEEKHYEIPATITDIYDSFKIILLGRSTVNSSLDFWILQLKKEFFRFMLSQYSKPRNEDPRLSMNLRFLSPIF
ncbi:MAG: NACHT domain-containing protein [Haliscomenobacter sp.]|nr:NACHT domain-containing protein [Haliscomenobacter sp.]